MQTQLPSAATRVPNPLLSVPPTRGAELVTRDGRSLPLVSAKLHADAQGGIARVVLEQRFENRYDETLHVTYRMPLPADGAVSGYAFQIAGRTITGRIDRKRAAREQFERAVASGKTAALLEQDRADIFTQSIGNLPAREALVAFIAVDLRLLWLREGEWELRFPTVIGPRYIGASDPPADVRATAITTAPEGVAPRIQIAVKIGDPLPPGRAPGSPSHALQRGSDGLVELRDIAGAKLDRDLVVRWPVAGATVGLALQLARPADRDETFGLVTIVPPAREVNHRALARDLIVLIDTSGSMSCGPLDKAKRVVAQLIESLGDDDRLELIEFSSQPRRYRPEPVRATPREQQAAIRWVRALTAGGSTEMRTAVIEAMRALRPGSQRQVVLATDGYIGGEEQIIQQLYRDLPASCRLHFVGVGSAVNRSLSTAMARAGRGAEVLCDLDEDVERAVKRLVDRTRMPILTNVTLAGSALVAQAPELLPDVFEGAPFVAAVQLRAGELIVRGDLAREAWEQRITVRPGASGNQAIVALFGRERVADLEARRAIGDARDGEIEGLGLAFQIATRMTSWIAIDEVRVTTGPSRHDDMPQALPYGTTAAAFGLRSAAPSRMAVARFADLDTGEDLDEQVRGYDASPLEHLGQLEERGMVDAQDDDTSRHSAAGLGWEDTGLMEADVAGPPAEAKDEAYEEPAYAKAKVQPRAYAPPILSSYGAQPPGSEPRDDETESVVAGEPRDEKRVETRGERYLQREPRRPRAAIENPPAPERALARTSAVRPTQRARWRIWMILTALALVIAALLWWLAA